MTTLLNWAARHRVIMLTLIGVYSSVMIAAHDSVQNFTFGCYARFGRERFNLGVTIASLCILAFITWRAAASFRTSRDRAAKAAYCAGSLLLLIASYNLLFYTNVEAIHFVQYALLAPPIFALTQRFSETIFFASLIGVIDECYQYFFIYQSRYRTHLDFNDMVLNLLGAATACVLILLLLDPAKLRKPLQRRVRPTGFRGLIRSPMLIATTVIVAACSVLFATGLMRVDAVPGEPQPLLLLSADGANQPFWKQTPWGKRHHDLRPLEGVLLLGGLFLLFAPMDRLLRGETRP